MRKIFFITIISTFLLTFIGCGGAGSSDLGEMSAVDIAKKYKAEGDSLKGKVVTVTGITSGGSDYPDYSRVSIGSKDVKGKVFVYCELSEKKKATWDEEIKIKGTITGGSTDGDGKVDLKPCEIVK